MTQDIGRGLSKAKRNIIEGEIKMYVISHHRFKFGNWIKKCSWEENFPIDQLVDDNNHILKFKTEEEALKTLEEWGIDTRYALQEGVKIEMVH